MGSVQDSTFAASPHPGRRELAVVAGAMFALGILAGMVVPAPLNPRALAPAAPRPAAQDRERTLSFGATSQRLGSIGVYAAEVARIIDGDTFVAHVQVWPGLSVDTKVRLRGVDAPELRARGDEERVKAEAARNALAAILAEGGVVISQVGIDKYGGRVDAAVATRNTADVSSALLSGGWARRYEGGRRGTWC